MSEKQILEKLIQDGKDAEAKLKKLDKPELKMGAYGTFVSPTENTGWFFITYYCKGAGLGIRYSTNPTEELSWSTQKKSSIIHTELGNLETDLTALGQDLESFNFAIGNSDLWVSIKADGSIHWHDGLASGYDVKTDQAKVIEFHRKLGQLIATAKRRKEE